MELTAFTNRLQKNARHFGRWAERQGLTAYRIYDRDIPEFPFAVDWYDGRVHLIEYPRRAAVRTGAASQLLEAARADVQRILEVPSSRIYAKTHFPKAWGKEQYEKHGGGGDRFTVQENGLKFWVNLGDYLDTGLFMDHRNTRARVRGEARGKRFLNLFAYTGSFSVYAAAGGARSTTTVDLSNTYLDWAQANLEENRLAGPQHELVRADALEWLAGAASSSELAGQFELIVLDPPSFSTSKAMRGTFEVQRDQVKLLRNATELLSPDGVLYFSTNFLGFHLRVEKLEGFTFVELTPKSIPEDFKQKAIHRCWRITRSSR